MAGNQTNSCEGLTTRQKIAVMQAFCSGKHIEVRSTREGLTNHHTKIPNWETWTLMREPFWNWDAYEYRVKPEIV